MSQPAALPLTKIVEVLIDRVDRVLGDDWISDQPTVDQVDQLEGTLKDLQHGPWPDDENPGANQFGVSFIEHICREAVSREAFEDDPEPDYAGLFRAAWRTADGIGEQFKLCQSMCWELETMLRGLDRGDVVTADEVAEQVDVLRAQIGLARRRLLRLRDQSARAVDAKAASPQRVSFKDVDRLLRGQLSAMGGRPPRRPRRAPSGVGDHQDPAFRPQRPAGGKMAERPSLGPLAGPSAHPRRLLRHVRAVHLTRR